MPPEHNFNNAAGLLLSDDFEGPWAKLNTTANNSIAHIFYDFVLGAIKIFICFFVQCLIEKERTDLRLLPQIRRLALALASVRGGDAGLT